jgi:hypothetical protein
MCSLQQAASRYEKRKAPHLAGQFSGGNGEVAVGDAKKNTDMIRMTVTNITRRYRHSASVVRAVVSD